MLEKPAQTSRPIHELFVRRNAFREEFVPSFFQRTVRRLCLITQPRHVLFGGALRESIDVSGKSLLELGR